MRTEDFIKLVADMRKAQRAYFQKRKYEDLNRAQTLERSVDKALNEIEGGQLSLFD